MVSSFGSNRVVVASLPFSVMPLLRSEAETDEANFCQYVYVTQLFVKEKPADFFGLAEMEDVYECTRNAIFWCYCHQVASDPCNQARLLCGHALHQLSRRLPAELLWLQMVYVS